MSRHTAAMIAQEYYQSGQYSVAIKYIYFIFICILCWFISYLFHVYFMYHIYFMFHTYFISISCFIPIHVSYLLYIYFISCIISTLHLFHVHIYYISISCFISFSNMSIRYFDAVALSYRKEKWSILLEDILHMSLRCATHMNRKDLASAMCLDLVGAEASRSREKRVEIQRQLASLIAVR